VLSEGVWNEGDDKKGKNTNKKNSIENIMESIMKITPLNISEIYQKS